MWNIFKVNSRNTTTYDAMTSFWCLCFFEHIWHIVNVFIVGFDMVKVGRNKTTETQTIRKKQYYLTLHLFICFKVGYRSSVTFKTKLFVATVISFHPFATFWHKELHLGCCVALELNIVKWSAKILKGKEEHPPWLGST